MDRVLPSEGRGCRFDTCRARHQFPVDPLREARLCASTASAGADHFGDHEARHAGGSDPGELSLSMRPTAAAGLANEVDAVNQ